MGLSAKTNLRVRYAETDQMGIVYHANYIVWFEVGRSALFRELNLPYTELEKQGVSLAVIEANCRYRQPAHYDDEITIITEVIKMSARGITFSYRILREETLLAEGKTLHVFVDKTGKLTNVKNYEIWQQLQPILERQGQLQKD